MNRHTFTLIEVLLAFLMLSILSYVLMSQLVSSLELKKELMTRQGAARRVDKFLTILERDLHHMPYPKDDTILLAAEYNDSDNKRSDTVHFVSTLKPNLLGQKSKAQDYQVSYFTKEIEDPAESFNLSLFREQHLFEGDLGEESLDSEREILSNLAYFSIDYWNGLSWGPAPSGLPLALKITLILKKKGSQEKLLEASKVIELASLTRVTL